MFSISFVRWFLGWVEFRIIPGGKGSSERFINLCARLGISLWKIGRSGESYTAAVSASRYIDLIPSARKAGIRLKSGRRHGLPFLWKRVSKRRGLVIGMVIFCAVIQILSMYVWSVQVKGNTEIPTQQIIKAADEFGLSPGSLKSRLDPLELQRKLMLKFPDISWLSVNTRGGAIEIALEERVKQPSASEKDIVSNLKATASGQILRMEVSRGVSQVKVGDAVVKGQLLVSGIAEDTQGNTRLMRSAGQIVAETEQSLTVEIPLQQTVVHPTGKTIVRRSARVFGLELPLSFTGVPKGEYEKESERVTLQGRTGELPISIYTETWYEQELEEVTLTEQQAKEQAEQKMEELIKESWQDIKILSSNKSGKIDAKVYRLTLHCRCEQNIAVEAEIPFSS